MKLIEMIRKAHCNNLSPSCASIFMEAYVVYPRQPRQGTLMPVIYIFPQPLYTRVKLQKYHPISLLQ